MRDQLIVRLNDAVPSDRLNANRSLVSRSRAFVATVRPSERPAVAVSRRSPSIQAVYAPPCVNWDPVCKWRLISIIMHPLTMIKIPVYLFFASPPPL